MDGQCRPKGASELTTARVATASRLARAGLVVAALAGWVVMSPPAMSETSRIDVEPSSFAGNYLAGRMAGRLNDAAAAARFYREALRDDPTNLDLLDRSFALSLVAGDYPTAFAAAQSLSELDPEHRLANLALAVDALRSRQYAEARRHLERAGDGPLAELTARLLLAWTAAGSGDTKGALATIQSLSGPDWYEVFKPYHSGLIAALAGDDTTAGQLFERAYATDQKAIRVVQAWARHLARTGRGAEAQEVLRGFSDVVPNHPIMTAALAEIAAGRVPAPVVTTAQEGAAEVLYGIGSALGSENGEEYSAIYLRLALHLAPGQPLAILSLADYFEKVGDRESAVNVYGSVPETSPLRVNADIHRALNLDDLDRTEEAIALLEQVIEANPDETEAIVALGNILRGREQFAKAAEVYSRAIAKITTPQPRDWALYYFRGMCYERAKRWPLAEIDLKAALALYPDQPHVLNYLGYSWVDQGVHLDEALDMISRAVELRPNDGYIVDSLGWAYYKLGRYEDAVRELERAVELKPNDPIINDHLGDAYWKAGRKLEARFQWTHARNLDPEPEELAKILKKLEHGLADQPGRAAVELRRNDG